MFAKKVGKIKHLNKEHTLKILALQYECDIKRKNTFIIKILYIYLYVLKNVSISNYNYCFYLLLKLFSNNYIFTIYYFFTIKIITIA